MTISAVWPLQKAIFALLSADSALKALTASDPARIFDDVPHKDGNSGLVFPFLVMDGVRMLPDNTDTIKGEVHDVLVSIWSTYAGKKQVIEIAEAVISVLDRMESNLELEDDGHTVIRSTFVEAEFAKVYEKTYSGSVRFEILTEEID